MRFIVYLAVAFLVACTSFQKSEDTATELQRGIRAGEVIVPGDEIRITTLDGQTIEMTVDRVEADGIVGKQHSVPIDQVDTLEIRRLSPERTIATTVGSALVVWWLIGLLLSAMVVFPA